MKERKWFEGSIILVLQCLIHDSLLDRALVQGILAQ